MSRFAKWPRLFSRAKRAPSPKPRRRQSARPTIEALEERQVPTVFFQPHFPGEAETSGSQNAALVSPPVYLLYWGAYWGTTQGQADVKNLTQSVQAIVNSQYLNGVSRYTPSLSAEHATLANPTPFVDSKDAVPNVRDGTTTVEAVSGKNVTDFINGAIASGGVATNSLSQAPIYFVITEPGAAYYDTTDGSTPKLNTDGTLQLHGGGAGYNSPGNYTDGTAYHYAYISTGFTSGSVTADSFTPVTSHELVEGMSYSATDKNGTHYNGVNVTLAPNSPPGDTQIADGEAGYYGYRLGGPGGPLVTSFYSHADGGQFIVQDGNAQEITFQAAPNAWSPGGPFSFNHHYTLTVLGDQRGLNTDDVLVITPSAAGTQITLNGESFFFGQDQGTIDTINVNLLGGNNTLVVNDQNGLSDTWTVTGSSLTGSAGLTVNYSNVTNLTLDGSNNEYNYLYVTGTSAATTTVNGGTKTLQIDVSPAHTLGGVGALTIDGKGVAALKVDDTADAAATTYGVTAAALTRNAAGQWPVTINYARLGGLTLFTGSAADVVNVESTSAPTAVFGGAGADTFNVAPSSLSMGGINNSLSFNGGSGGAALVINDEANPSSPVLLLKPSTQYAVAAGSLTRSVFYPSPLRGGGRTTTGTVNYQGLKSLTLNAGNNGPNTVNIESTSVPTYVHGGTATSSISVAYNLKTLDNIGAYLSISGASSDVAVYDQADTDANAGRPIAYTVSVEGITRDAIYNKSDVFTRIDTVPVKSVTLYTSQTKGSLPNTVSAGSWLTPVTILSGAAAAVTVTELGGALTVDAHGGTVTFDDRGLQNSFSPYTTNPQHTHGYSVTDYSLGYTVTDHTVVRGEHVHWVEIIQPGPGSPTGGSVARDYYFNGTLSYQNAKSLTIAGSPVDSTFFVQSTPAGMPVAITGSTGSRVSVPGIPGGPTVNQFIVGLNGSVKNIRSQLTLNGSAPSDTLLVDDSQAITQDKVTVAPTQVGAAPTDQFFGAGGGLTYSGFSALTLNLSHAADDTVRLSPSAVTAFFINGDPTEFQAGHGAVLNLDLTGVLNALLNPGGPGAGDWAFANRQAVTFKNLASAQAH
jgi:hypothetical protein